MERLKNGKIFLPRFRTYDELVARAVDMSEPEDLPITSVGSLKVLMSIDLDVAKGSKKVSGILQGSKLLDLASNTTALKEDTLEILNDEGAGAKIDVLSVTTVGQSFERREPRSVDIAISAMSKKLPDNPSLARVFQAALPEILSHRAFRENPKLAALKDTVRYLFRNIEAVIVGDKDTFAVGRYPDDYTDKKKRGKYYLYMNPRFVFNAAAESLTSTADALLYILAHESLHIRLGHLDEESYAGSRVSVKNPDLDNLIFDAIINGKVSDWMDFTGPVDHGVWASDPVKFTLYYGINEDGRLVVSSDPFPGSSTRIIAIPGSRNRPGTYKSFFMVFFAALVHIIRDFVEDFAKKEEGKNKDKQSGQEDQDKGDSSGGETGEGTPGEGSETGDQDSGENQGGSGQGSDAGQDSGTDQGDSGQGSGSDREGQSQKGGEGSENTGSGGDGGQQGPQSGGEGPDLPSGSSGRSDDSPDLSDIFGEDDSPDTGKTGVLDDHSGMAGNKSKDAKGEEDPEEKGEDVISGEELDGVRKGVERASTDTPESSSEGDDYLEQDEDKKLADEKSKAKHDPKAYASGVEYSEEEVDQAIVPPEKANLEVPRGIEDREDELDSGARDPSLERILRRIIPFYLTEYQRVRKPDLPSRKVQGLWGASITKKGVNEDSIIVMVDVSASINHKYASHHLARTFRLIKKIAPNVKYVWIIFHSTKITYRRYKVEELQSAGRLLSLMTRAQEIVLGGNGSESILGYVIRRVASQTGKKGDIKLALWFTDLQFSLRDDRKAWTVAPLAIINPSGYGTASQDLFRKYHAFIYGTSTSRGGGKVLLIGRMLRSQAPAIAGFLKKFM